MKAEGTRHFDAPRARVWEVIADPAEMAGLMPGAEEFELVDDTHWRANVRVPVGPGIRLTMNFEQLERRPPEFASMRGRGKAFGAGIEMTTSFSLSDDDGRTAVGWQADVTPSGLLGSIGESSLRTIVDEQVEGIMSALERRLGDA